MPQVEFKFIRKKGATLVHERYTIGNTQNKREKIVMA